MFLAIRAVMDTAGDAIELDVPSNAGVLAGANMRLDAFINLYNLQLDELKEERKSWKSETRLEKALKMLAVINPDKLKPTAHCMKQLKGKILDDARGENWLRTKVQFLECVDGISFKELLN